MNPLRPNENLNPNQNNENLNQNLDNNEKYRQIELDPARQKQQNPAKFNPSQIPINVPQMPANALPTAPVQSTDDPIKHVRDMISSGYTPSLGLIQDTATLLKSGNNDWANTWFAVLMQKLVKEKK
jgi:hypothetical protein